MVPPTAVCEGPEAPGGCSGAALCGRRWRARALQRLLDRLTAALRGGPLGTLNRVQPGPGARGLLLLKLWATLFPASDRRHAVLTPAALIVGACLAMCPLARAADVAQGAGACARDCMIASLTYAGGLDVCHALHPVARLSDLAYCAHTETLETLTLLYLRFLVNVRKRHGCINSYRACP